MPRILVVDDDRNVCTSLAIALRSEGHEIDLCPSDQDAVETAANGGYRIVFMGEYALGGEGYPALAALRERSPGTAVVVMSGEGSVEDAVAAMQRGASHYVHKPIQIGEVVKIVDRALSGQRPEVAGALAAGVDIGAACGVIGQSPAIQELLELVSKVAQTDSTVLVHGETGTGKELIGRALHQLSPRRDRVFCAVNSAAFPETLLESELFGHRRGAFTGASNNKKGLFEHADRGTVFLDEVAEMPLSMQAKLLRFLQTGEIRAVGGESTRYVDVRLVTATNKDLEKEVAAGRFREDLYYRLAVIPLTVPPLRERPEDIPVLAQHFLRRFASRQGKSIDVIESAAMD
ncbi:MAG: sigma-54 dependent transcriptional regulator, partial [Proteobacteria bacterium]|nr:sigma-54 dependent transcriptional regulator [Pseudomonadota bacterium]